MTKSVLILGGGIGGLVAANELAHKLGRTHRITLIDRSPKHIYSASFPWIMRGWRRPEQAVKDLRRMIRPEVELVQSEIKSIDPQNQRVRTDTAELGYDYLVIALGAELAPETIPGYNQSTHDYYTLEGVTRLANELKSFPGGKVALVVAKLPYKCPAAPYEGALMLRDLFKSRGLLKKVDIQVYTPESLPMPVAGPVLGQAVKGVVEKAGIGFHAGLQLESINPDGREIKFRDGAVACYDLLIVVPPHRAPHALEGSSLVNEAGWVPVDKQTLRSHFNNVYAVGDVTAITLPNGKLLPKAGVFAHFEALIVAQNISADILGAKSEAHFNGLGYCWIEIGSGLAGFATGNFYGEPEPVIELRRPGRLWHWGKIAFENYWLGESLRRKSAQRVLMMGSKFLNIPGSL